MKNDGQYLGTLCTRVTSHTQHQKQEKQNIAWLMTSRRATPRVGQNEGERSEARKSQVKSTKNFRGGIGIPGAYDPVSKSKTCH